MIAKASIEIAQTVKMARVARRPMYASMVARVSVPPHPALSPGGRGLREEGVYL
jgi:hypothetical protein